MNDLTTWLIARNRALETLDLGWAREVLGKGATDEVLTIALHKSRYECKAIADPLRHESAAWLRARGFGGLTGPLLPAGELPA